MNHLLDLVFLALCLWREARGESRETKVAVAYSIVTRPKPGRWWGTTVYDCIVKPWQYSSMTDFRDKQLCFFPKRTDKVWLECWEIASKVMEGSEPNPVPGADSYFDISIPAPKWATEERFVKQLGRIKFYKVEAK